MSGPHRAQMARDPPLPERVDLDQSDSRLRTRSQGSHRRSKSREPHFSTPRAPKAHGQEWLLWVASGRSR